MIKVLLMGRKQITAKVLEFLDKSTKFQVVGILTDSHLKNSPTTLKAKALGVDFYEFDQALAAIKKGGLVFDLGLSVLYWRKLKDEFLTMPKFGVINFHPAPLPDYKGTAGYNLAIIDALETWGVTAHYVDENIDTGEIITVDSFSIDVDFETVVSLEKKSIDRLESQVYKVCDQINSNEVFLPTTPNIGGRYVSRAEMESMKEIIEGDDVDRKVRAFWYPPYDGAFIRLNGQKYTVVNREILMQLAPTGTTSLFAESSDSKALVC